MKLINECWFFHSWHKENRGRICKDCGRCERWRFDSENGVLSPLGIGDGRWLKCNFEIIRKEFMSKADWIKTKAKDLRHGEETFKRDLKNRAKALNFLESER